MSLLAHWDASRLREGTIGDEIITYYISENQAVLDGVPLTGLQLLR